MKAFRQWARLTSASVWHSDDSYTGCHRKKRAGRTQAGPSSHVLWNRTAALPLRSVIPPALDRLLSSIRTWSADCSKGEGASAEHRNRCPERCSVTEIREQPLSLSGEKPNGLRRGTAQPSAPFPPPFLSVQQSKRAKSALEAEASQCGGWASAGISHANSHYCLGKLRWIPAPDYTALIHYHNYCST